MAGMDLGNEKQMSTNVATKVILRFSDLASAEKSVKKRTQFFSYCKTGMRSSKFVFYGLSNVCIEQLDAQLKIRKKSLHSKDVEWRANWMEIDIKWGIGTYNLIQNICAYLLHRAISIEKHPPGYYIICVQWPIWTFLL